MYALYYLHRLKEYEGDGKRKDIKVIENVKLQNVLMLIQIYCNHLHLVKLKN